VRQPLAASVFNDGSCPHSSIEQSEARPKVKLERTVQPIPDSEMNGKWIEREANDIYRCLFADTDGVRYCSTNQKISIRQRFAECSLGDKEMAFLAIRAIIRGTLCLSFGCMFPDGDASKGSRRKGRRRRQRFALQGKHVQSLALNHVVSHCPLYSYFRLSVFRQRHINAVRKISFNAPN
jgi:hypothetical protein